jgi:GT2 family glycosyltransferase/glycosyltransferase involved in cell wall biosynthesis
MSKQDLVSIIIPVFNGADYVAQAIRSALSQTWEELEIIVVDDGSMDGGSTERAVRSFDQVRYVRQTNKGVGGALNTGIAHMRGDWFCWLSHDDIYHPERVASHMDALSRHPPGTLSFGDVDFIDAQCRPLHGACMTAGMDDILQPPETIWTLLEGKLSGCTLTIPRHILVEAGGFDPNLPTTQDYELWFRLAQKHRFLPVPGAFVSQRLHPGQGSRASRHLEEASILWGQMLEYLDTLPGTEAEQILRMRRAASFLEPAPYAGACRRANRLLAARMSNRRANLVVRHAENAEEIGRCVSLVRDAGVSIVGVLICDERDSHRPALALEPWAGVPNARHVRVCSDPAASDFIAMAEGSESADIAIVIDAASTPSAGPALRDGLAYVAAGTTRFWHDGNGFDRICVLGLPVDREEAVGLPVTPWQDKNAAYPVGRAGAVEGGEEAPLLQNMPTGDRPTILMILHSWGGGTARLVSSIASTVRGRANVLYGWGLDNQSIQISSISHECPEVEWPANDVGIAAAARAMRALGVTRLDIFHTIGFERSILDFVDLVGVPYDVTLTDYNLLADGPHLLDPQGYFIGDEHLADPSHPSRRPLGDMSLLASASRRLACSRDLAWRASHLSGGLDIQAVEVPEVMPPSSYAVQVPLISDDEELRVLCLGRMVEHKGLNEIIHAARRSVEENFKLVIYCLGAEFRHFPADLQLNGRIVALGGYSQGDLNPLICEIRPHLAWLPFRAPETYSFTLSECLLQGLPVLTTKVGAIPERLMDRPATWLLEPKASAEQHYAMLKTLRSERLSTPSTSLPARSLPPIHRGFYRNAYLKVA